jgi:hypothetical protein
LLGLNSVSEKACLYFSRFEFNKESILELFRGSFSVKKGANPVGTVIGATSNKNKSFE